MDWSQLKILELILMEHIQKWDFLVAQSMLCAAQLIQSHLKMEVKDQVELEVGYMLIIIILHTFFHKQLQ